MVAAAKPAGGVVSNTGAINETSGPLLFNIEVVGPDNDIFSLGIGGSNLMAPGGGCDGGGVGELFRPRLLCNFEIVAANPPLKVGIELRPLKPLLRLLEEVMAWKGGDKSFLGSLTPEKDATHLSLTLLRATLFGANGVFGSWNIGN